MLQGSNFIMAENPHLFDLEPERLPENAAAKAVIDRLLKVRRSLSVDEQRFGLPKINLLIDELRSLARATPTQREEMVLYSVERQCAVTETEIAGDTKLHPTLVKEIVADLIVKGLLYKVKRTVIGSGRQNFAIKSTRVKLPEAD